MGKANEGAVPQYYVEGSHDAIIEPAEWQLVQMEMQRRKNTGWKSARRFKAGSGRGIGFLPDASDRLMGIQGDKLS